MIDNEHIEDVIHKDKKRLNRRKRNLIAKALRDQGDHKGAFSLRTINPKKTEYKRKKLRINDVNDYENDD